MFPKKVKIHTDFNYFISNHAGNNYTPVLKNLKNSKKITYPDTYTYENTLCEWKGYNPKKLHLTDDLEKQLKIKITSMSSIMQPPGHSMPAHLDNFYRDKIEKSKLVRYNIFLQDFELGHVLQMQTSNGVTHHSIDWTSGEGWAWDSTVWHLSANIGIVPKYTLQITGMLEA